MFDVSGGLRGLWTLSSVLAAVDLSKHTVGSRPHVPLLQQLQQKSICMTTGHIRWKNKNSFHFWQGRNCTLGQAATLLAALVSVLIRLEVERSYLP